MYTFTGITLFFCCCVVVKNELVDSDEYQQKLEALARQTMLQQFYTEQRVRTEGQSGVKLQRQTKTSSKNYGVETHSSAAAASIHDHSNNIRTVGMGEFMAVLNGVEFQTRHNDYRLFMPHRTSGEYHETEPIPFPDVPPEVTSKKSVDEQIVEMKEWFKAFRDQNSTVRDYRKYFKPTLCYLEGAWTHTGNNIDEPFSSDRHFIDANTWMELHEKTRFSAYSGSKSVLENFAFLPRKIMNVNKSSVEMAQWNYRILCHPLKKDLPLKRLRVIEDLSSRMMMDRGINRHLHSRGARFQVNPRDQDEFYEKSTARNHLDDLMEEIPGMDNYQGKQYDEGIDVAALNDNMKKKDVSRYHRWYRIQHKDAMGRTTIHRGYNDDYLFMAKTSQPKVSRLTYKTCRKEKNRKTCKNLTQKWTYAIPLEIIYLTPLSKWNPHNLTYKGEYKYKKNKKTGNCDPILKQEYDGVDSKTYYITPSEFYTGENVGRTNADTAANSVCVLDQNGIPRKTRASGVHIFLPSIKGVGVLRQRYPIFPVHGEGSSVWKELNALREIVMDRQRFHYMMWNYNTVGIKNSHGNTELQMLPSRSSLTTRHTHSLTLSADEVSQVKGGRPIYLTTSTDNNHQHNLKIVYYQKEERYVYLECDDKKKCWDNHGNRLNLEDN